VTDRTPTLYVAVVGPADAIPEHIAMAEETGRLLAAAQAVVVTGGLDGVMAAACRGARSAGGRTVGLLPGGQRSDANPWVDVAIPTGLGELRNALVVRAADAVIGVGGSWGTLSELALAGRAGKPVVTLAGWQIRDSAGEPVPAAWEVAADPAEAVTKALAAARP
jgi:uncharacterized protein (TIGR00725 family)